MADEEVGYDLGDWTDEQRAQLASELAAESVGVRWEHDELVVDEADSARVEALIEEIDGPLADEDEAGADLLSALYVAADVLQHDPDDAPAIVELIDAAELASTSRPPYGLDPDVWRDLRDKASELAGLLGDEASKPEVMKAARALREAVHPLV